VDLSSKFADDVVAVIGLGGTGSYIVDFLVKTPVKEIRGFISMTSKYITRIARQGDFRKVN